MLHMRLALELLDSSDAPALIGARLAHAIDALQRELDRLPSLTGTPAGDRTAS
jgi:hypothetical protein